MTESKVQVPTRSTSGLKAYHRKSATRTPIALKIALAPVPVDGSDFLAIGCSLGPRLGEMRRLMSRNFRRHGRLICIDDSLDHCGSFGPQCPVQSIAAFIVVFDDEAFPSAGARELGWDGEQVYRFATEKLALKTAVVSLKALGPVQLKALAGFIQREVRTVRVSRELAGAATSR